jgi:hypothetical protein
MLQSFKEKMLEEVSVISLKRIVSVQGVGRAGWSFEPGQPLTAA